MTPLQFENVTIIKQSTGRILGFHNETLEVAQLSESLFKAVSRGIDGEEVAELKAWSQSYRSSAHSPQQKAKIKILTINATQLCNLRCTYCAAGGDGTYGAPIAKLEVSRALPQLEWLLSKLPAGESFQINFLGGEPLLYPDIIEVIAQSALEMASSSQINIRFSVVTNGVRLTDDKIIELLVKFRFAVTVSVDGPPEIQDRFRPQKGGKSSSRDLEAGLRKLQRSKHFLTSIGLTAVFHDKYFDVLKTYRYFRQWNFDFYELNYSHTDFDVQGSKEYVNGLAEVAALCDATGGEAELRKIRSFDNLFISLDQQTKQFNYCGAGKSILSMDAKGSLFACPWDINENERQLGATQGLVEQNLQAYEIAQVEKPQCQKCWARYLCGGGCGFTHQKSSGSYQKVDLTFCERTRGLIMIAINYYEKFRRTENETY